MNLRVRITMLAAAAVTVSIALVAVVVFVLEQRELQAEVDTNLREHAVAVASQVLDTSGEVRLPDGSGSLPAYAQIVRPDGTVLPVLGHGGDPLPVDPAVRAVAAGEQDRFATDVEVDGQPLRVLTVPLDGVALQVAEPLREVRAHLLNLGGLLAAITLGGLSIAALLGWLVAREALRPVAQLTAGAERVSATGDLTTRLQAHGTDELARLAGTLNGMLEALETSQRSQRQLVADASHELRTPLASMQTNLEVLEQAEQLPDDERERLVADLRRELTGLISTVQDLLDLARDGEQDGSVETLSLTALVADGVDEAQRRFPQLRFHASLQPVLVSGNRALLHRAVGNLLDNAAKWSPDGGTVEVSVDAAGLEVRDHGPGVAAEDLPRLFERFYRAPAARSMPGSGLGLAIVRQVTDLHGWRVSAANADAGGTRFRIDLTAPHSSPGLNQPSSRSHEPEVNWRTSDQHSEGRPGSRLPRSVRIGLVVMAVVPLLAALGVSQLGADEEPTRLRTVIGTLERCDAGFCVASAVVDFGPGWYLRSMHGGHDYDRDGQARGLGEELGRLLGREVTLETDGGSFDEDVYALNGLPVREPDGELPAPQAPTATAVAPAVAVGPVTGMLRRCGEGYCIGGVRLDFGPLWYVNAAPAAQDYDGDGRWCAVVTELDGLLGREVTARVHGHDDDAEVTHLGGLAYRETGAPPPWAGGPLRADRVTAPSC